MIVAADYDGTYNTHPELHGSVDFIITGNPYTEFNRIMNEWEGEKLPIFFNPIEKGKEDLMNIVNHKANIINKCKVKKYYEDQFEQKEMLAILAPNCEIVLVKDGQTFI